MYTGCTVVFSSFYTECTVDIKTFDVLHKTLFNFKRDIANFNPYKQFHEFATIRPPPGRDWMSRSVLMR